MAGVSHLAMANCDKSSKFRIADDTAAFAKMAGRATMEVGSSVIACELNFPHNYDIRGCPELPGSGQPDVPVHYFPSLSTRPEHDGVWVEVCPSGGSPWLGVFAFGFNGDSTGPGITKVLSTPDPGRVCVISGGGAYLVKADNPVEWAKIPMLPITQARSVPEYGFLLLANFRNLAAWDSSGEVWRTEFHFDGLRITKMGSDVIEGYGYDPAFNADVPFSVNTRTGSHRPY
jgi:hypothetical protein